MVSNVLSKKEAICLIPVVVIICFLFLQAVGSPSHSVATDQLVVNGQTVTVKLFDDRTVNYQWSLKRTIIGIKGNKLDATDVMMFPLRGVIVSHRQPTAAEAALWHKYFG